MLTNSMALPNFSASLLSASSTTLKSLRRLAASLSLALLMNVAVSVGTPTAARAEHPSEGISAVELRPFLGTWYFQDGDTNNELYIGSVEVKQKGRGAEIKLEFDHWIANRSHKHGTATTTEAFMLVGDLVCSFKEGGHSSIGLMPRGLDAVSVAVVGNSDRPFHNQFITGHYEMHDAAWAKDARKNHPYVEGGFMKTMEVVSLVGMGMQEGMAQQASTEAAEQAAIQQAAADQQAQIQAQQQAALAAGSAYGSSSQQPQQTPLQQTVPYTKCSPSPNGAACGVE